MGRQFFPRSSVLLTIMDMLPVRGPPSRSSHPVMATYARPLRPMADSLAKLLHTQYG